MPPKPSSPHKVEDNTEEPEESKDYADESPAVRQKLEHYNVFNPSKHLPDNFFLILYGMRRCGKSTSLNHMLYSMRSRLKDYRVYLFSGTAKVDPMQYKYFPKSHQFHDIEMLDDDIGGILEDQTARLEVPDSKRDAVMAKNKFLIVMDDCVNENTIRHSKSLNYMAVSGRHIGGSVIILSQLVAGSGSVPPIIRTQADAVMLCALPRSQRERDLISENYLTSEDNSSAKEKGKALMEIVTSVQYRNMLIAMWDTSLRKTKDFVYTYGPCPEKSMPDGFQLGSKEAWEEESDSSDGGDGHSANDDSDDSDAEGEVGKKANDIHGGRGLKNKGLANTEDDALRMTKKMIAGAEQDDSQYLPPAFSKGRQTLFRSFVQYSMTGSRDSTTVDAYEVRQHGGDPLKVSARKRLQGQRFEKPEKAPKPNKKYKSHKKHRVSSYGGILSSSKFNVLKNRAPAKL